MSVDRSVHRSVRCSVHWTVCWSHVAFSPLTGCFFVFVFFCFFFCTTVPAKILVGLFHHCLCTPARDCGSHVSGHVNGRSLHLFPHSFCSSVRSLHLLPSFTSYLTHFAHFLVGTVEIHKYVFTLKTGFTESLEILVENRNIPSI